MLLRDIIHGFQTDRRDRPGASQTITHKTGLPIASFDISPHKTHAVLAGREILKTIRVSREHTSEEFNIRNAVISYSSTHRPAGGISAKHKDQLAVKDVKWSHGPYDTIIATAVANGRIVIYDLHRAGLELARFHGHSRQVHRLAFNPHFPSWLLSGSQDSTIRMWDLRMAAGERGVATTGSKERYNGNSDAVRDVRWSPSDGVMFATATDSGVIQCWDYRKANAPVLRITAHDKACFAVDWHPDGKHLVSGGTDKQVKVWDFSSSAERRQKPTFQFRTPQAVVNVRWRPPSWDSESEGSGDWQSTQLVTSYDKEDPRIHLWDIRRPHMPFQEFDRYDSPTTDLLWHSKDLLWTVGENGAFTQTDIRYAPQVANQRRMCSVAWSPNGDVLAFAQKRPKQRASGLNTTEFLAFREEERSNGEKATSQSLTDDSLDDSVLTSSLRKGHSKVSSVRSSKSLSNTPPSTEDNPSVIPLEKSLSESRSLEPCQLGAVGRVPGVTTDPKLFQYLARNYSPLMQDSGSGLQRRDALTTLLDAFDHNAECTEEVGLLKLAQTWRIVKYSVVQELRLRAQEQQLLREKGADSSKKRLSKDEELLDRSHGAEEGKHEKMKTRLFKGVMETEGHMKVLPDAESTSNMTTPVAQPLPDSPPPGSHRSPSSRHVSLQNDLVDLQPLPPSAMSSNYGTVSSNDLAISDPDSQPMARFQHHQIQSSEDMQEMSGSPTSDLQHETVLQETEGDQRSAPRAIAGRADWRLQQTSQDDGKGASVEDYDQKMEHKRAAIRDYRQFPKKPLSFDPPAGELTKLPQTGHFSRHDSAESFPMFSASTDSSHRAKSMGASFSPRMRPQETPQMDSEDWDTEVENVREKTDEAAVEPSLISPLRHDTDDQLRDTSFDESLSDANNIHLERPSSPPPLLVEYSRTRDLDQEHPSQPNGNAPGTNEPADLDSRGDIDDGLEWVTIPLTPELTGSKPWSAQVILREAIRHYYSGTAADVQTAAHLLHKLHVLFYACEKILPHEECELVFKTYNELLLRLSMYVEAAELRLLCVPAYPAVYEYAQADTYINVFCYTCKRPYENPKRDNTRCYRCQTPQEPCSICMSLDPPPEWTTGPSTSFTFSASDDQGSDLGSASHLSSSSSASTEPIPASEMERLDQASHDYTVPRRFGSALWSWCQGCGHGGHLACITTWLNDIAISEGGCATPGCMHDCGPGPRREQNRALALEESKRRDAAGRKASLGFVKRDSWAAGESKAVEKARGMLGVAAPAGAPRAPAGGATTGPGPTPSGMMSPKKVRLVTPSEQSKRKGGGGEGFGSRDRQTASDP